MNEDKLMKIFFKLNLWGPKLILIIYTVSSEILPPFYFCPSHPHCQQVNLRLGNYFLSKQFFNNCVNKKEYQFQTG